MSKTAALQFTSAQAEFISKMGEFFKEFNYDRIFYNHLFTRLNKAMNTQLLHEKHSKE